MCIFMTVKSYEGLSSTYLAPSGQHIKLFVTPKCDNHIGSWSSWLPRSFHKLHKSEHLCGLSDNSKCYLHLNKQQ